MTAPIVYVDTRNPIPDERVKRIAKINGDADKMTTILHDWGRTKPPGQLWDRLREHANQRPEPTWFRPFPIQQVADARLGEERETS